MSRPDPVEEVARDAAAKRRRVAEVFGDVVPATTADEREQPAAEHRDDRDDERIHREVPPHHG